MPNTSRPKDKGKRKEQEQKQKLETREKRVGTQKVRELEDHSGDVSDKQRQKQVQSTETLENTTLFIYPSKQTLSWHKPKIAARQVGFTLRSLHFTFINMHICYLYTPTFSSKSLICLLWISVLSSRSRILCKNKKMEKSVFFFHTKRPNEPPDAFCRDYLVSLVQQFHPLLEDLAVVLATLPQHLPPQLLHRRPQLILLQLIQRFAIFYHLKEGFFPLTSVEWYCFYTHVTDGLIKSPVTILNRRNWNKLRLQSPYPAAAHCIKLLPIPGFAVNGKREGCNYAIIAL